MSIQVNIDDLKEEKIIALKELLQMHPGNHMLNFLVYDITEKIKLQMPSRRQKVKVSQELLDELKEQNFVYKLN